MSDMAEEVSDGQASSPLDAAGERPQTPPENDDDETSADKTEEAAGGGEEVEEAPPLAWPGSGEPQLLSAGDGAALVAGKRAKKSVERLDMQAPKHKEKLQIAQGSGDKLGDIPRINFQIGKLKTDDLKPLHAILFERPGKMTSIKKNLRLFNGFPFAAGSEQYVKKQDKLLKNTHLTNSKLKQVCGVLDLEKKGTHTELVERIMTFLMEPKNSGKQPPMKKKKRSKKKASGDSAAKKSKQGKSAAKSRRASSSSLSSPKKSASKSEAIVMDSSSDDNQEDEEDEDEEDEEEEVPDNDASDAEDGSSNKADDNDEEAVPSASKKRPRTAAKKTPPPRKRVKRDLSDDIDSDSDEGKKKKPKKKKSAAKTKKADSSSKNADTDGTSDENEPLIRMINRAPSDEQLTETLRALLEDADLEQMTMKHICQKVFDAYPGQDLSGRKDFIKQSVKSLIT
ncbi:protein DEK-like isoform X3 [Festucalex cinctus]